MTKKEADTIIKACKQYHLKAVISRVLDDYSIILENRMEFNNFEATKLAVNALVLEKRMKIQKEEKDPPEHDASFLKVRHHFHKKTDKSPGNWGQRRSGDSSSEENFNR